MPGIVLSNPSVLSKGGLLAITAAHPEGCRALVRQQISQAVQAFPKPLEGAENKVALVIGSTSFGYGSAAAVALKKAGFSRVIGIGFETPPIVSGDKVRRASPGWYLTRELHDRNVVDRTYFADAFSDSIRDVVIRELMNWEDQINLVLYSLAAPARTHLGQTWKSSLKVIGDPMQVMALDYKSGQLVPKKVEAATESEVENTRRVMGGEDLNLWANGLLYGGLLAQGATVAALSYVGPEPFKEVRRLYWEGTVGAAKKHIDATTRDLNERLMRTVRGKALSVVNPAVVTVASANIPAIAKYLAAYLGVVDGGVGIYNDPLAVGVQFVRALYGPDEGWRKMLDDEGRLRLDADEIKDENLQNAIMQVWAENNQEGNPTPVLARGLELYKKLFVHLFGFEVPGVDYNQPYEFDLPLKPEMEIYDLISAPNQPPVKVDLPDVSLEVPDTLRSEQAQNGSALDKFFGELLARENEPGVTQIQEGDKTVFVSEVTLDPHKALQYAAATLQTWKADKDLKDPTVPSAYTFALAFPNILDAVKPILRGAARKTVIHAAEEIDIKGPILPSDKVTIRVWLDAVKKRGETTMVFLNREITNGEGSVQATGRTTLIIGIDPREMKPTAAKGDGLPGSIKSTMRMTQKWIDEYADASGDHNPIHVSEEAAAELGFSSPIAHGALIMAIAANKTGFSRYRATFKTPLQRDEAMDFECTEDQVVGTKKGPQGEKWTVIELVRK